jgi:hypothetical protein
MESPFDAMNSKTCTLYLEPMLNSYYKSYQNILTVSNIPDGPLADLIQPISSPKLSPFQSMSAFSPPPVSRSAYSQMCMLILCRYPTTSQTSSVKYADNFMYAGDIPNVIGYLESNGYRIMTDMTKLAYKGPVNFASSLPGMYNKRQLVFMFKYEGK